MYNKLDPRQITLHTFSSPSGHMHFAQTETEVFVDFSSGITGNFNFVGDLFVNEGEVLSSDSSNIKRGVATMILGGQNHFVSGTNTVIVGGDSHEASGVRNLILNGINGVINDTASDGTILAGYGCEITGFDGATIVADGRAAIKRAVGENTLTVDFENGMFVQNAAIVQDDLNVGGSGEFSGDFNVLGTMYYTGKEVSTQDYMEGHVLGVSGVLDADILSASGALSTYLELTGSGLNERIQLDLDDLVRQTGNQIISGSKEFADGIKIYPEIAIEGTGSLPNSLILEDDLSVDLSSGKNVTISSTDSLIVLLDHDNDGDFESNDFSTIWDSSLIVATGNNDPDVAGTIFGVHPSGIVYAKDSLIIDSPSVVPVTPTDPGFKGQMVWEGTDQGYGLLYLNTGEDWIRFTGVSW